MQIGDPNIFAIESQISIAYERLSFRALGYLVLHIGGRRYGVHEPDATMLGCAFNAAGKIIAKRGRHTAPFASEPDAGAIVDAIGLAVYATDPGAEKFFGIAMEDIPDRSPWEQKDYKHDPETLKDVWLEADEFYGILQRWRNEFESEWAKSAKVSEEDEACERVMAEIYRLNKLTEGLHASRGEPHHYDDVPENP